MLPDEVPEAMRDGFFWDAGDATGPFGNETGREVLEALRDLRASAARADPMDLLAELLESWEVADTGWEVVEERAVAALGAEDEHSLLLRDDAVIALAFACLAVDHTVPLELRRRAILALTRQGQEALLHGYGDLAARRKAAVERMRAVLGGLSR